MKRFSLNTKKKKIGDRHGNPFVPPPSSFEMFYVLPKGTNQCRQRHERSVQSEEFVKPNMPTWHHQNIRNNQKYFSCANKKRVPIATSYPPLPPPPPLNSGTHHIQGKLHEGKLTCWLVCADPNHAKMIGHWATRTKNVMSATDR